MLNLRYKILFILSWLGLLWERLWNRLWLVATLAAFFLALSLFDIPLAFGIYWHAAILAFFAVSLSLALLRFSGPAFSIPTFSDVERRMEQASALRHRPLETLHDAPVEGTSEEALGLWQKHLRKTALYIHQLKAYKPQPEISRRDRLALRYISVLFIAVGLVIAQGEAFSRIKESLTLDTSALLGKKSALLDLWITPPEYTRQPTIFLATAKQGLTAQANPLQIPEGSLLKLRLSGFSHPPKLNFAGQAYPLSEVTPGNYVLEMPLQQSGALSLSSWYARFGHWDLSVLPDTPPETSILRTEATPRAAVKITYQAKDDYGIVKMSGLIKASLPQEGLPPAKEISFNIAAGGNGEAAHVEDLTSHPWAGWPVTLTLEAEDAAGHKTTSAATGFILPERQFTNPVAQSIIHERKTLFRPRNAAEIQAVAQNLAGLAENPQLYKGDKIIFMSLLTAAKRLMYDGSDEARESVQGLLWDVALKLEDGGLSLAQRELRDALQKMSEALQDKSLSKQELQELLDDVQKKMQQYVQSLAQEMQQRLRQGKSMPVMSPALAQKFMKNIDLGKMLEQMRMLSQANSREDLQKLAERLKNAIDNIDMKKFDEMQQKQMQAMEALQTLEDIIQQQQKLFDKTNKTEDTEDMKEQKEEQSGIRSQLGEVLRKLGETTPAIPENFPKADQSMKLSAEALGKALRQESLPQQKKALEELQAGMDEAIKQMAQSMQQSILSFGGMPSSGNFGAGFDPLGRENGKIGTDDINIPTEKELRRVQEIIEELRNRSNEPDRTKVEREYIDRLLDQF